MEQIRWLRILWEKTEHQTARVLRVFAGEAVLTLPDIIENSPVTEIGAYCFAESSRLPEHYLETVLCQQGGHDSGLWEQVWGMGTDKAQRTWTEFSGSYIEEITLPDTIEKIGNLAFYNCTSLRKISLGKRMDAVGSDAFMNCRKFKEILLRSSVQEKSGIRQILSQISADMEVTFLGNAGIEAVVFYPEYYESYDEIAPAHLFGRNIEGEGFRARQCFKEGVPDLTLYDTIFPKACAEENDKTLRKLVITRLCYPVGMNEQARSLYEAYFTAHSMEIAEELTQKKEIEAVRYFCDRALFSAPSLEKAIQTATAMEWAEGVAELLHIKQQYLKPQAGDRYAFDDF